MVKFTSSQELSNILKTVKGSSVCTMELTTKVKTNKKGRINKLPFTETFEGDVFRTYKEYGNFNINYENAVNNQLVRENKDNNFVSNSLPWGEWYSPNKVIAHKNEFYLRYYTGMNANSKADKQEIYHYENGQELTALEVSRLSEYLPPKRTTSGTQGTTKEITPRVVKMNGVNKLTLGGVTYTRN